jgi:uncharacterized protein (TIGR00725 family)
MEQLLDKPFVAVCGGAIADQRLQEIAFEVGRLLAERNAVVITGGLGGVMESACRGAKAEDGLTIGIIPSSDRSAANEFVDIVIPTGLGEARNMLLVNTAQVVIAIGGEYGTLSEVALALKIGKPVVGIDTWRLFIGGEERESIYRVDLAQDAVEWAIKMCQEQKR